MLKSALFHLEKLVGEALRDGVASGDEFPAAAISGRLQPLAEACSALKEKWLRELFSSVKEPVLSRYVQYHQAGLIALSDELSRKIPDAYFRGKGTPAHHLYFAVVSELEELLRFLKQGFYKHFDIDRKASRAWCRSQAEQILDLTERTAAALGRSQIDKLLTDAIAVSVKNKVADARQTGISYRQLESCWSLLSTISSLLEENAGRTTHEFARELYRQNFNSYHFIRWYQQYLSAVFHAAPETERENVVLREIDLLKQIFAAPGSQFEPELPGVNVQLLAWLEQFLLFPPGSIPNDLLKPGARLRMPLRFSVTQFALFVRVCYLEGCFHVNNVAGIFRFFTRHFETKKQLNISLKSFSRAFYGVDQATAAVVRDFLQRMINTIDKIYFP